MKRALKKQIKQDELLNGYERAQLWARGHGEEVRVTLVGLVVVALGVGALYYFRAHRMQEAQVAFDDALTVFRAPVGTTGPGEPRGQFATNSEKLKRAAVAFDGVAHRFPSQDQGRQALLMSAACKLALGQGEDAASTLREIAAQHRKDDIRPALAELALADLNRSKGAVDKALEGYKKILDTADSPLPRDAVLMSYASALDEARRDAEALAAFKRLIDEFPASVYAADARRRVDYLKGAGRG